MRGTFLSGIIVTVVFLFLVSPLFSGNPQKLKTHTDSRKTSYQIKFAKPFRLSISCSHTTYVEVTIVLEVTEAEMEKFFQPKTKENPKGLLKKIRHEITMIICSKTEEEIDSVQDKAELANQIRDELNRILQKKTKGIVKKVLFPKFIIQ
jgi:flagellar basal body-associated protein FliL